MPWLGGGVTPGVGGKATSPCLSGAFRAGIGLPRCHCGPRNMGRAEWTHRGASSGGDVPPPCPAHPSAFAESAHSRRDNGPAPESGAVGTQGICPHDCLLCPLQGAGRELGGSLQCGQAGVTSQRYVTRLRLARRPPNSQRGGAGPLSRKNTFLPGTGPRRRGLLWISRPPTDQALGGCEVTGSETILACHPLACLRQ